MMSIRSILMAAVSCVAMCVPALAHAHAQGDALGVDADARARPVKVMIISMFGPEAQPWRAHLGPWRAIRVEGLSPDYPHVYCNRHEVCLVTTGMGYANAAATIMALTFSPRFDLRKTYFMIAGIAGVDPARGTIGSAAWAKYLVDFGVQWELDAREIPAGWDSGYLGINTKSPLEKPPLDYRTEVFPLNAQLADTAFALSRPALLADSDTAKQARAKFDFAPANQPPTVIQCDIASSDTWWSGTRLGERARQWTRILTDGAGTYCMTAQEDNATFEALKRASIAKRVDLTRVVALRTGADFDRPYNGQTSADNLLNYAAQGGFAIATENLYRAGNPLVQDIVTHWNEWRAGVPRR